MKTVLAIMALTILVGCTRPVSEWETSSNTDMQTIPGMEDCTYRKIFTGSVHLHIIRCPNSTVSTTTSGKNPIKTITESN